MRSAPHSALLLLTLGSTAWACTQAPYTLLTNSVDLGAVTANTSVPVKLQAMTTSYSGGDLGPVTIPTPGVAGKISLERYISDATFNGNPSPFTITVNLIPTLVGPQTGTLTLGASCGSTPWATTYPIAI